MTATRSLPTLRRLLSWRVLALAAVGIYFCAGALGIYRARRAPSPAPVIAAEPAHAVAVPAPAFPLKVGPTRRYLVDQRDRPFLVVGDSPQALIVNTSEAEASRFIANRAAAGFNSLWVHLLTLDDVGGRPDGSTRDGIKPFKVDGDLATPNERYFERAKAIVRLAQERGVAVFLDPIETAGWTEALRRNGVEKAYAYGRYVGQQFRDARNIVWFNGNDFQTWRNARDDALVTAVSRGIRSAAPDQMQTVELDYLVSSSSDDPHWKGLIDIDAAYTYMPTYAKVADDYARPDFLPILLVEAHYEGEWDYRGPQTLRRQEYWSILSGASGQFYGNKFTWPVTKQWENRLDTLGSRQMTFTRNLFVTRPWYDLVPDTAHKVLVSGYGTYRSKGSINDSDYATAAATPDGKLMIAYLPSKRTVGVDLSKFSGPITARWYDPAAGTFTVISNAPLKNSGLRRFMPPGDNQDGNDDWVLVLEVAHR